MIEVFKKQNGKMIHIQTISFPIKKIKPKKELDESTQDWIEFKKLFLK